jgi:type III secretion system FlhB-like substrate exporter
VPRIAAAGRGTIAERILQLAYENGIYVREDGDLAQLLAKIELDSPIPSETFRRSGDPFVCVPRQRPTRSFDTDAKFSKNGNN